MSMPKSNIGYKNDQVTEYYGWNPCGYGCSRGCDGCWAKKWAARGLAKCEMCKKFQVHVHPNRMRQPEDTKIVGVVLANFCNDWLDPQRESRWIDSMMEMMLGRAPWHHYVTLTKNAKRLRRLIMAMSWPVGWDAANISHGLSVCNQEMADQLATFSDEQLKRMWISFEPLWEAVKFWWMTPVATARHIRGAIVGHDRRKGAPGTETLEWVRQIVKQCDITMTPVYVKQLWIDGKLVTDAEKFPVDLRRRNLPWGPPNGSPVSHENAVGPSPIAKCQMPNANCQV